MNWMSVSEPFWENGFVIRDVCNTGSCLKLCCRKFHQVRFEGEDDYENEIFSRILRKVSIVIFSEGDYALSRSQNDKTSNI